MKRLTRPYVLSYIGCNDEVVGAVAVDVGRQQRQTESVVGGRCDHRLGV